MMSLFAPCATTRNLVRSLVVPPFWVELGETDVFVGFVGTVVSGGWDKKVKLWDSRNPTPLMVRPWA